ncbi:HtaA domain-containing protein [Actinosynnema sp. NPDC050436]|uniref:HtaA domain-containing protein n=1 Tax=Actinosynnema sp. NPDC050436 TaxID=3155659 RepID=UPI0033FF6E74
MRLAGVAAAGALLAAVTPPAWAQQTTTAQTTTAQTTTAQTTTAQTTTAQTTTAQTTTAQTTTARPGTARQSAAQATTAQEQAAQPTTTGSASCELTSETATRGDLLWGFKKSFRQYVGTTAGNAITASDGAVVTAVDEVVRDGVPNPAGIPTGAYRFALGRAEYRSPTDFTLHYRGKVAFSYPAHFFTLVLGDPEVRRDGDTATLRADVELKAQPGAPTGSKNLPDVDLATLRPTAGTTTPAPGSLTWSAVPASLTSAEAFAGFYQAGAELDQVALTAAADCADLPEPPPPAPAGTPPPAVRANALVPPLQYRPLANTGADVEHVLWLGISVLLAGTAVLLAVHRPRRT